MAKVKVWNDNVHPHREKYQDEWIDIPAGGYIELDWEDAIQFKGQFTGIKLLGDDTPDPRGFKMIRVEKPSEPVFKENPLVCHANGERAVTQEDLARLLDKFSHMRAPANPDVETAPAGGPTYQELMERVLALEEKFGDRKKPGPKPKLQKEA